MGRVVVETQSPCRQRVDVGRVNLTAKAADIRIAHIVHIDDDDVWCAFACALGFRLPGFGYGTRSADLTLEAVRMRFP
jgi:hypothetical protein